jgi:molybdopterin converting factor small subunit
VAGRTVQVHIQLFSVLRECLPSEAERGRATIELPAGTKLDGLVSHLGLVEKLRLQPGQSLLEADWPVMLNGSLQRSLDRVLEDGDQVSVFPPLSGG